MRKPLHLLALIGTLVLCLVAVVLISGGEPEETNPPPAVEEPDRVCRHHPAPTGSPYSPGRPTIEVAGPVPVSPPWDAPPPESLASAGLLPAHRVHPRPVDHGRLTGYRPPVPGALPDPRSQQAPRFNPGGVNGRRAPR